MQPLVLPADARITFLTGAGISVASGLRPYRGPGGLWNEVDVAAWATAEALARDPIGCFRAHRSFAALAAAAQPNAVHHAIAAFARARPEGHVVVITQNVDGLHQRAGAPHVIELHGSLFRLRCSDERCAARIAAPDPSAHVDERAAKEALRACGVFVAAGTSGVVFPAAAYVREADDAGARTILVNLEPPSPPNPYFDDVVLGRAEEILPALLGADPITS